MTDDRTICECGQDMDSHAGGFALLHHDEVIVAEERARIVAGVEATPGLIGHASCIDLTAVLRIIEGSS